MIKQVAIADLMIGMYICDINRDWIDHPFFRGSFLLRRPNDLAWLRESGIDSVFIDTRRGLDPDAVPTPADTQDLEASEPEPAPELPPAAAPPEPRPRSVTATPTPFHEEVVIARQVRREAERVVRSVLQDARHGQKVQVEHLSPVVIRIADSVLRNPGALLSLCRMREADSCTFQHSLSSCALMILFAHHLGLDRHSMEEAGLGGMLHDIGKMRVPEHILNKPSAFTDEEFEVMRTHVPLGLETLAQTPGISDMVVQVAAEHHERCDGSGYPEGLTGAELTLLGRMAAIVDVYDALSSMRVYHHNLEPAAALRQVYLWSPDLFDRGLVEQFIQAVGIYPVGSLVRLASGRLGVVTDQNRSNLLRPVVRVFYDIRMGRRLPPRDLDLSTPELADEPILSAEDAGEWRVNPLSILNPGQSA